MDVLQRFHRWAQPRGGPGGGWSRLGIAMTVAPVALIVGSTAKAVPVDGEVCTSSVDVSASGRFIVFDFDAPLTATDTNAACDAYLLDTDSGRVELISRGPAGVGNSDSGRAAISNDGRFVAFESRATNLAAGSGGDEHQVFLRDRTTGQTSFVSKSTNGAAGNAGSFSPDVSGNGAFVAFESDSTNLGGATGGNRQILVWKRASGTFLRASTANGQPIAGTNVDPSIDDGGTHVAFRTDAAGFAPATGLHAAILRDLGAPTTKVIHPTCHVVTTGRCVADVRAGPELDGDGRRVVVGFNEPAVPFSDQTAAMVRVADSKELFAIDDLFRAAFVAISRDGRVITASDGFGDFLEFVGGRGQECIDDSDDHGDLALTGNGGAVAFSKNDAIPMLTKLHYNDGRCIFQ
jgi:hypothetical protein